MSVVFSNGDGFALYNGVKLPNIDSVWNKSEKPYGAIVFDTVHQNYYFVSYPGTIYCQGTDGFYISTYMNGFVLSGSEWVSATVHGGTPIYKHFIWSNRDLNNTNGELTYTADPDPIPLDGYNLIEWDGDTTGLDVVNETHYRVSDYFSKPSEAVGVGNNTYSGELFTFSGVGTEDSNYTWTSPAGSTSVCGVKDSGVYFYSYEVESNPIYASLFAYKEAVGGVESVTIEPSEVTVNPGAVIQFSAIVSGTGEYSQDLTWELGFGEQYGTPTITQTGTVSIPADMLPCKVFVVARSAQNETVSGLSTINVEEDKTYSVNSSTMTAIANAIRKLKGSTDQYTPTEMPGAIEPDVVTAIDYSAWESGEFTETLDNGTTLKYAVTLEDGKPTQVTAPDGTVTAVDWGNS